MKRVPCGVNGELDFLIALCKRGVNMTIKEY
jgi:hypothetical protein